LRDALGAAWAVGATEGEVGDVDLVLAEDGADAADNAGDVVVADGNEGSVERSLDVDAVVGEQPGRGSVEDCGGGADVAVGGVEDELENRACASGGELLLVFLDANATLCGDGCRIDAVGYNGWLDVVLGTCEDTGDGGVADEVVLPCAMRPV
jgi:hypothetical protein